MKPVYTLEIIIAGFLFSLLSPCLVVAQTGDFQHQKDSLIQIVANAKGEKKLDAYWDLTVFLFNYEHQSDIYESYFDDYIKEALKQGNIHVAARAKKNVITKLKNELKYKEGLDRIEKTLPFLFENEEWDYYYEVYQHEIELLFFTGKKELAVEKCNQMYEQAKQANHSYGIQRALLSLGNIYLESTRIQETEDVYKQCLEEANKTNKVTNLKLDCYINLAFLYVRMDSTEEAEELLNRLENDIKIFEKQGNEIAARLYDLNRIRLRIYSNKKDWEKVEEYCNLLDKEGYLNENTQKAIYDTKLEMYMERKEWTKALECVNIVFGIAEKKGSLQNLSVCLAYKTIIFYNLGRTDEGYAALNEFAIMRDSISKTDFNAQLDDLRTQYEVDRHVSEKQRNRNYFLFALGGCLLLAVALGIYMHYNRKLAWKNRELIRKAQQWANVEPSSMIADTDELPGEEHLPKAAEPDEADKLLFAEIEQLIDGGLYKENSLNLDMLAAKTNQNTTYVSKAVSHCTGKTFKTWLSEYRVKEAVRLLSDKNNPNISIETVSWDSGFNDRKTFYRIFRKATGLSPTDFKKNELHK